MKQILLLFTILAFIVQGCNLGISGSWKNENIDTSISYEIQILNEKIIEAVTTNNPDLLKSLMSDKLLEKSANDIEKILQQASNIIKNNEYRILDNYYVKISNTGTNSTVLSGLRNDNDYIIHFKALNKEMFVSLIIPDKEIDEFLITSIYGKYPDGWKLNIIQFGQYSINNKTATELYEQAKTEYEKGYLVDAFNSMYLGSIVSKPANNFWQFQNEEDMKVFYDSLMTEMVNNFKFPIILSDIKTKPQIFNVFPFGMAEGYFPMVEYLTEIDLKDTANTKKENNKIHQSIGEIFKGLDKDKKLVFYKAYNEIPNGKTPVQTYGFVKENK